MFRSIADLLATIGMLNLFLQVMLAVYLSTKSVHKKTYLNELGLRLGNENTKSPFVEK